MSFLRTPFTLTASDRLAQRVQEGKIVRDGSPGAEKPPIDGERLTLPSLQVREYDRNPRRSVNPLHDEIKESARARGGLSLGDLTVTRRPRSDDYMIYGGGNTRLRVIHELARELPDDPRFAHVSVVFREWRGEADIMAAHLIENEVRADTTFFDKAHGLTQFKLELENAEGGRLIGPKELCKRAEALGWKISPETIRLYGFVMKQLSAVGRWLSFRSAQTLMARAGALTSLARKLDPQRAPALVQTALAEELDAEANRLQAETSPIGADDAADVDAVRVCVELEGRVAAALGVSVSALRQMLTVLSLDSEATAAKLRAGIDEGSPEPLTADTSSTNTALPSPTAQIPLPTPMLAAVPSPALPDPFEDQEAGLRAGLPPLENQGEVPAELASRHVPDVAAVSPAGGEPPRPSPEAVRAAHDLRDALHQLAEHTSNAELFRLAPHMPLGYLMEPPDRPMLVAGPLPPEIVLQRAGWQLLATLSTQFDRRCEYALPAESRWCEAVRADGIGPLLERCGVTVNGDRIELDAECLFIVLTEPKQLSPTMLRVLSALAVRRSTLARVLPTRLELITSAQAGAG